MDIFDEDDGRRLQDSIGVIVAVVVILCVNDSSGPGELLIDTDDV
jgi:hypothetical protein